MSFRRKVILEAEPKSSGMPLRQKDLVPTVKRESDGSYTTDANNWRK